MVSEPFKRHPILPSHKNLGPNSFELWSSDLLYHSPDTLRLVELTEVGFDAGRLQYVCSNVLGKRMASVWNVSFNHLQFSHISCLQTLKGLWRFVKLSVGMTLEHVLIGMRLTIDVCNAIPECCRWSIVKRQYVSNLKLMVSRARCPRARTSRLVSGMQNTFV